MTETMDRDLVGIVESAVAGDESAEELSAYEYDASGNEIIKESIVASDPRLSGTWTEVWGCRGAPVEVCTASVRVENEDGAWLGRAEWFGGPPVGAFGWTVLEGQGDYAGLTAFARSACKAQDCEPNVLAIYEGELPPYPELPVE